MRPEVNGLDELKTVSATRGVTSYSIKQQTAQTQAYTYVNGKLIYSRVGTLEQ